MGIEEALVSLQNNIQKITGTKFSPQDRNEFLEKKDIPTGSTTGETTTKTLEANPDKLPQSINTDVAEIITRARTAGVSSDTLTRFNNTITERLNNLRNNPFYTSYQGTENKQTILADSGKIDMEDMLRKTLDDLSKAKENKDKIRIFETFNRNFENLLDRESDKAINLKNRINNKETQAAKKDLVKEPIYRLDENGKPIPGEIYAYGDFRPGTIIVDLAKAQKVGDPNFTAEIPVEQRKYMFRLDLGDGLKDYYLTDLPKGTQVLVEKNNKKVKEEVEVFLLDKKGNRLATGIMSGDISKESKLYAFAKNQDLPDNDPNKFVFKKDQKFFAAFEANLGKGLKTYYLTREMYAELRLKELEGAQRVRKSNGVDSIDDIPGETKKNGVRIISNIAKSSLRTLGSQVTRYLTRGIRGLFS